MLGKQFMSRDLAQGENILFAATGISDSPLLRGVQVQGTVATTHSVHMRARSGTVRFIEAHQQPGEEDDPSEINPGGEKSLTIAACRATRWID